MLENLRLDLVQQGDLLKLTWSGSVDESQFEYPPYLINASRVQKAAVEVRAVLDRITSAYIGSDGSYANELMNLARAGESLKVVLFDGPDAPSDTPDEVLEMLNNTGHRIPLTIFTDGKVQAPWGFVFMSDPRKIVFTGDITDFADFWHSKFRMVTRYNFAPAVCKSVKRDELKALYALHEKRFLSATEALKHDPEFKEQWAQLARCPVGETTDWEDCRTKWETIRMSDSLIYVFAHSDGNQIFLKDIDGTNEVDRRAVLDTAGFQTTFLKPRDARSQTLCFINGCRSAEGTFGDGFISITARRGFQGFIGAEAEVSNYFAMRYGTAFLYNLIYKEKSVAEVFEELRVRFFPESLVYSCFANPAFRIT